MRVGGWYAPLSLSINGLPKKGGHYLGGMYNEEVEYKRVGNKQ